MNCGNCGTANDYDATVCCKCGSTLALTEYYRPTGFVEKKNTPKKPKKEPWDQDILTEGYKKKPRPPVEEAKPSTPQKTGTSAGQKTSGKTPANSAAGKKTSSSGQSTSASKTKAMPKKITDNKIRKEISNSRVYNHTTKKLTLAEKTVRKTKKKKSRRWIFPGILIVFLLFAAAAIFVGTMNAGSREDRFKQVAEDFVCAVVMNDEARAADCIHPKMYGSVRPMSYDNVQRCEANAYTTELIDAETLSQELSKTYGIGDPITELYRIRVGYTLYGEQSYGVTKAMDVFVAQIGDGIYAVKTENID